MLKTKSGIFLFNIIPSYRPGMRKVFDHGFYDLACTPTLAQRTKQNTLYTSLEDIAGESLSDLDLLYIMATDGTSTFAKINWKDPGNFTATDGSAAPTFSADIGFEGNETDQYLTTGWDPDTDGVNFTLNEGGVFAYSNTNNGSAGNHFLFGSHNAANAGRVELIPKNIGSVHVYAINGAGTDSVGTSPVSSQGFFHIRRTATNDLRLYKDGAQVGTTEVAVTTDALNNDDIYLLTTNINGVASGFSAEQMGCFGIGASLAGQESALYTAWNTYFSSL